MGAIYEMSSKLLSQKGREDTGCTLCTDLYCSYFIRVEGIYCLFM